jgi:hypothetical protein
VKLFFSGLWAFSFVPGCLSAAEIKGKIIDPSGAPIVGDAPRLNFVAGLKWELP